LFHALCGSASAAFAAIPDGGFEADLVEQRRDMATIQCHSKLVQRLAKYERLEGKHPALMGGEVDDLGEDDPLQKQKEAYMRYKDEKDFLILMYKSWTHGNWAFEQQQKLYVCSFHCAVWSWISSTLSHGE
jgi:hypothetical protein